MSLASYSDLKTALPRWLRRADIADVIPDLIALTEVSMTRELRTALQLVVQPFTINGEFVARPVGFQMMRGLRLTGGPGGLLKEWTVEEMMEAKAFPTVLQGIPRRYTLVGSQFEFWPVPTQAYTAAIAYQATIPALSDTNPSNWILAGHPDAYLYGALSAGSAFAKNPEQAELWKDQFDRVIGEIQDALRPSYDRTLRCDPAITRASRFDAMMLFQGGGGPTPIIDDGGGFDFSDPDNSAFIGS